MQYLLSAPQVLIGPAGRHFDNGAVLVQGESIVAVGGHDEVRAAAGADLVELAFRAQQLLNCGVTTVRDLGDRGGLTVALRESIEAGDLAGPRILAATAPLTPPGGHCWFLGGEVAGSDQIRQQIRRNAAAGADVIKVMVSGGSMKVHTLAARSGALVL
ncbi:MAG: hypothetical protein DLM60_21745 [Pseudonocardiales bacterium]|nr:MAG: hypothetical protein DLM60_21745 [Pseudonocardiales bacterium]